MKDTTKELSELDDLIEIYSNTIDETVKTFKTDVENSGLTMTLAEKLEYITDETIKDMTLVEINELLETTGCSDDALKTPYYHLPDKSITFNEFSVDILQKLKSKWLSIKEAESNLAEIKKDRLDISRSYLDSLKSPEYRQARIDHVNFLREQLENETDESKKRSLSKKLDDIEKSQTYSFLNDRLHQYGKEEAMRIADSYFDQRRGSYVMKKYYDRLKRLGINQAIHGQFFNLEERFLPEHYEMFNNLFLYHVIRFIAYMDPDNKSDYLFMASIVGALRDLVSGESTDDSKEAIINIMKDFYSFFDTNEYKEMFKSKNVSYKNHPDRIEAEKKAAENRKVQMLAMIKAELGSLFDENQTYNDPENFFNDIIKEKLNMLEFISKNGNPGGLHTYEEIFNEFTRLQKLLPEVVEEDDRDESDECETIECGDEVSSSVDESVDESDDRNE